LSLCADGNARFRLQTPGQRPGGPKAISYQFAPEGQKRFHITGQKTDFLSAIEEQDKRIDQLTKQLKEQASQIQKVNAQLEVGKAAPTVVADIQQDFQDNLSEAGWSWRCRSVRFQRATSLHWERTSR
jgi:hypothetical protein